MSFFKISKKYFATETTLQALKPKHTDASDRTRFYSLNINGQSFTKALFIGKIYMQILKHSFGRDN